MRHVMRGVLFAALVSMLASLLWAALPFTDNFTAADGTALATYNANWTVLTGAASVFSNAAGTNHAGTVTLAKDNSNTYSGDQIATGIIKTPTDGVYSGTALNLTTGENGYQCRVDSNEFAMVRRGTFAVLWSATTPTIQDGDEVRGWREGNNLYCQLWRTGALQYDSGAVADTTHTAGSPGIGGFGVSDSAKTRIDDVTLDDYPPAGGATPIRRRPIMTFFTLPEFAQ